MNTLKIKLTIPCGTCGDLVKRTKSIKVSANNESDARKEAETNISIWRESIKGTDCAFCKRIKKELAG